MGRGYALSVTPFVMTENPSAVFARQIKGVARRGDLGCERLTSSPTAKAVFFSVTGMKENPCGKPMPIFVLGVRLVRRPDDRALLIFVSSPSG